MTFIFVCLCMCVGDQVGKHSATELHLSLSILFYKNADEARGESMCLAVISIQKHLLCSSESRCGMKRESELPTSE